MSFVGTKGPVTVREDPSYEIGQGWTTNVTVEGEHNAVLGLANQYIASGYRFTIRNNGPISILQGERAAKSANEDQEFYDRFTFRKEKIQKSIFSLEDLQAEALTYGNSATYRWLIENAVNGDDTDRNLFELELDEFFYPKAHEALVMLKRGQTDYEDEYISLTRDRIVSIRYANKLTLLSQRLIYATNELIAVFGIPTFAAVSFPTNDPDSGPPFTRYGWRRRRQDIQYIEGGRAQITEDWTFAAWSKIIYSTYSP